MTINNIVFDLGNVVVDIDATQTWQQLIALGIQNPQRIFEITGQHRAVDAFECGQIESHDFFDALREFSDGGDIEDQDLHDAWCAMIHAIPQYRLDILRQLQTHFRLFVLSNTNALHYSYFEKKLAATTDVSSFEDLFEKTYYSFEVGLRKPNEAIFEHVLSDSGLKAANTLFIDDLKNNVEAAEQVGFRTYHAATPESAWEQMQGLLSLHDN